MVHRRYRKTVYIQSQVVDPDQHREAPPEVEYAAEPTVTQGPVRVTISTPLSDIAIEHTSL